MAEFEFESGESQASKTYPAQASSLRKGGHIVIKGRPCKIVEMSRSQPGKHGHAKTNFITLDLFTGKKLEHVISSTHNVDVPRVKRIEYILVNISYDGYLSLMDDNGELKNDLKVPEGYIGKEMREKFNNDEEVVVTILSAMGEEMVVSIKTPPTRRP